jgi:hypothetical protein
MTCALWHVLSGAARGKHTHGVCCSSHARALLPYTSVISNQTDYGGKALPCRPQKARPASKDLCGKVYVYHTGSCGKVYVYHTGLCLSHKLMRQGLHSSHRSTFITQVHAVRSTCTTQVFVYHTGSCGKVYVYNTGLRAPRVGAYVSHRSVCTVCVP